MRTWLTFLVIFVVCTVDAQSEVGANNPAYKLTDGTWKTNIHCFITDSIESYSLTVVDDLHWHWGNFITFTDSTFYTDYQASCGVDCFTDVHGTYKFVGDNQIEIYVEYINREGFCQDPDSGLIKVERSYGIYVIEQMRNGLKLVKSK